LAAIQPPQVAAPGTYTQKFSLWQIYKLSVANIHTHTYRYTDISRKYTYTYIQIYLANVHTHAYRYLSLGMQPQVAAPATCSQKRSLWHTCIHTDISICIYLYLSVPICTYLYLCILICLCVCVNVCVCVCVCVCIYVYITCEFACKHAQSGSSRCHKYASL